MDIFGRTPTVDGKARTVLGDLSEDPSPFEILQAVDQKAGDDVDRDDVVSTMRELDESVDQKLAAIEGDDVDQKEMRTAASMIADRTEFSEPAVMDLLSAAAEAADRMDPMHFVDEFDELDEDTDEADALRGRRGTLTYWRNGLDWQTSEGDWTAETELTIGAMTAGEEAMMHREVPDQVGDDEFRLWFVAATVEAGPFVEDELSDTFANVANLHPAVVKWVEAKANSLGTASDEGNRSSKSSPATDSEATSAPAPDSTT